MDPEREQEAACHPQGPQGKRPARSDAGGQASHLGRGERDHQGERQERRARRGRRVAGQLDQQVGQEHEQGPERPVEQKGQQGQTDERAGSKKAQGHHGPVAAAILNQHEASQQGHACDGCHHGAGGPT